MFTRWIGLFLVGLTAVWSQANLSELGFEGSSSTWSDPWGAGTLGGAGDGRFVSADEQNFVRSGDASLRLTVRDDGNPNAVAWSGISSVQPCVPRSKVRAGAWFYYSSCDSPPTEGRALGQLRLEYFRDANGNEIIPTHISLSSPFSSSEACANDTWHLVQVYDRIPSDAHSLKFSILLLSQQPNGQEKKVWVDDAFLELRAPRARSAYLEQQRL